MQAKFRYKVKWQTLSMILQIVRNTGLKFLLENFIFEYFYIVRPNARKDTRENKNCANCFLNFTAWINVDGLSIQRICTSEITLFEYLRHKGWSLYRDARVMVFRIRESFDADSADVDDVAHDGCIFPVSNRDWVTSSR